MKIEKFEDIVAWKKSVDFAIKIYKLFDDIKDYGFKNQIERAVVSISNNIAEGFERKTNNEFKMFLFISKGSCGEVRSMLHIAKELKMIDEKDFELLIKDSLEISKMISGLIKTL